MRSQFANAERADMEPSYAIVELMGHVRFGARTEVVEFCGEKMLRCEILAPEGDGVLAEQMVSPKSFYRVTKCTEAVARRDNTDRYRVTNAVPGLAPPEPATFPQLGASSRRRGRDARYDNDDYDYLGDAPLEDDEEEDRGGYSAENPPDLDAVLQTLTLVEDFGTTKDPHAVLLEIDQKGLDRLEAAILAWSPAERFEAWEWAAVEHLAAGNGGERLTVPECVKKLRAGAL